MTIVQINVIINTKWFYGENVIRTSTVNDIGIMLLSKYLLPFEVVSILLLAALIGASMLSRKKAE